MNVSEAFSAPLRPDWRGRYVYAFWLFLRYRELKDMRRAIRCHALLVKMQQEWRISIDDTISAMDAAQETRKWATSMLLG